MKSHFQKVTFDTHVIEYINMHHADLMLTYGELLANLQCVIDKEQKDR